MSGNELPYDYVKSLFLESNNKYKKMYSSKARSLFASVLLRHRDYRRWHYGVKLPHQSPSSLAYLYSMDNLTLYTLLYLIDLVTFRFSANGTYEMRLQKENFNNLFITESLQKDIYFFQMGVLGKEDVVFWVKEVQ